jgi:hypothetical protein
MIHALQPVILRQLPKAGAHELAVLVTTPAQARIRCTARVMACAYRDAVGYAAGAPGLLRRTLTIPCMSRLRAFHGCPWSRFCSLTGPVVARVAPLLRCRFPRRNPNRCASTHRHPSD